MTGELTPREREVWALIAQGLSNDAIGERLGVAEATVRSHATTLFDKLHVKNRTGAALLYVQHELTEARTEAETLRKRLKDAEPELRALLFYLNRAVKLFEELCEQNN